MIHKLEVYDQGDYQCLASNRVGSSRGSVRLIVGRLPFFVHTPKDLGFDLGNPNGAKSLEVLEKNCVIVIKLPINQYTIVLLKVMYNM